MTQTIETLKKLIGTETRWYCGEYHSCEVSMVQSDTGIKLKFNDICINNKIDTIEIFPDDKRLIRITKYNGEVKIIWNVSVPRTKNSIEKFYQMLFNKIVRPMVLDSVPKDIIERYKGWNRKYRY